MSIRIMTAVWANSPYAGGTLLTLLAMADWSNDEGLCWPSVPTLAKKTRQSVANTRNCIRRMESDGAVTVERMPSAGTSNRYRINIEVLSEIGQRPKQKTKRGGRRGSKTERDQTLEESNRGAGPTKESLPTPPSFGPNTSVDTKDTSPVCLGNLFPEIPSTNDSLDGALETVFQFFVVQTKKDPARYKLTSKRKTKGLTRLKECKKEAKDGKLETAVEIMKVAVERIAMSPFHNGQNKQSQRYMEWQTHFLRGDWDEFYAMWLDDSRFSAQNCAKGTTISEPAGGCSEADRG